MKKFFSIILFVSILFSFSLNLDLKLGEKFIPPGTVMVEPNFYMDETEITNFNWLEYLFWTSRIYGDSSTQYKACLPNQDLWLKEDSCIQDFANVYLRHPAYRDFPLVGITQQQAIDFCKWRSDRVFEYFLQKKRVIQWDKEIELDSTKFFTIERYFAGEYKSMTPDPRYLKYPIFKLPTEEQWHLAHAYFDKLASQNKSKQKIFQNKKLLENYLIYYDVMPCSGDVFLDMPTHKVLGINMLGNVSEWLSEKDKIIGGDWKTKRANPVSRKQTALFPSVTIGFRCACEFKVFEK